MIAPGTPIRVVDAADETLEPAFIGRVGIVRRVRGYVGIGDAPPDDALVEVAHAPAFGQGRAVQVYWREEIEALR